ncbi:hypothetical protein INT45_006982 [Circinella minor]|uniref:Uncharacterized protein n=1 Tax=Circinella minor TaxID=1195481 RepID=A0A8H7S5W2_9FUNG|nr:hypothetical protein INT45_006982 [Circinella minor]
MSRNDITPEQIQELLELAAKLRTSDTERNKSEPYDLPTEIMEDLETPKRNLQNNLKQFTKDLIKYEGGRWTQPGGINQNFIPELKQQTMDTYSSIQGKYKDAEKLRSTGRAAMEIYEDLEYIMEHNQNDELLKDIREKIRRLAIFGFASAKQIDVEAKEMARKALRLPTAVRHIEQDDDEEKDLAFSQEAIEQINRVRFETALINKSHQPGHNYDRRQPNYRGGRSRGSFFGNRPRKPWRQQPHHQQNTQTEYTKSNNNNQQ